MSDRRILCVGLCNLDIIQVCDTFPAEDSDQRSLRSLWQRGGNASNNCTVLALLGANCELLATFSSSEHFKQVAVRDLQRRGIIIENCVFYENCEIPLSTVWLSRTSGSRTIVHSNPNLPELRFEDFCKCELAGYNWIHFEGRRTATEISKMLEAVQKWNNCPNNSKITVSVDLEKPRDSNLLLIPNAAVIFLGKDFARFRGFHSASDAVHGFKKVYPGSYTIICPWGSSGVSAIDSSGTYYSCGVYPPEQIQDSLGAGDTFCAGCIFQLSRGESLLSAIEFGSRLAGRKIGDFGFDHLVTQEKPQIG